MGVGLKETIQFSPIPSFSLTMKLSSILLFVVAPALIFARYTPNHQSWRHANKGQRLLGILKKRTDFHLGVALDSNIAQESQQGGKSADLNCLKPNMDLGVQTYEFKWDPIEKDGLDHWNTKPTDEMVSWLHGHGKLFRGHCGIWDQSTPQWVQQLDGPQNREKLKQALYNHIYKIVTRYGHQMIAFDVINEPFDYSSKGTFKNDVFWRNLGYDMFVIAFQAANKAKRDIGSTHLKLYINELGIEGSHSNNNQKRKAMMSLIDKLRQLHVQFDGIGLQGHFTVDDFPEVSYFFYPLSLSRS